MVVVIVFVVMLLDVNIEISGGDNIFGVAVLVLQNVIVVDVLMLRVCSMVL